jgi:hypothetical protein
MLHFLVYPSALVFLSFLKNQVLLVSS